MTSTLSKFIAAIALLLGCVGSLRASIQPGDFVQLFDRIGAPGGIFEVDDLTFTNPTDPDTPNFYTFCTEVSEFISFAPDKYKVGSVGTTTIATGKTVTDYTAWLYTSFLDNSLLAGTFDSTNLSDVNALQLAIWYSVGWTLHGTDALDDYLSSSWLTTYGNVLSTKPWQPGGSGTGSFAASGWTPGDLAGVQVMNLLAKDHHNNYTINAQDQLFREMPTPPGGSFSAPEAASFMIWGVLVYCGVFATGRRRG